MSEKLFYRKLGSGRPLVVLHGLFGSSDNWLTIGKALSEHFQVFLVDQRNHGQSFHSDEHNYDVLASDLRTFLESEIESRPHGEKPIVMGHSMGGKTAMKFALEHAALIEKLIIVDISPRGYHVHHDSILEGLKAIDLSATESRKEADERLEAFVPEPGVRQFLLKNLSRTSEGFEWKINLKALDDNLEKIVEEIKGKPVQLPALFIRGEKSNYIQDKDRVYIKNLFPEAAIVTIHDAGHWVHAEQPEAFLKTVESFLL